VLDVSSSTASRLPPWTGRTVSAAAERMRAEGTLAPRDAWMLADLRRRLAALGDGRGRRRGLDVLRCARMEKR
jgi:hypothetical protein